MAIPITGAGSLFVRLGHIAGVLLDLLASAGGGITAPDYSTGYTAKVKTNVIPDYAAGTAAYDLIHGSTTPQGVASPGDVLVATAAQNATINQYAQYLQRLAQATLIQMANADTPQPSLTLALAMNLLISQLQGNYNVAASTVAAGTQTNGTPTPNGSYSASGNSGPIVVVSVKNGKGTNQDNTLAETLTVTTTKDSQSGGATQWNEPYTVAGQADASGGNTLSPLWPSGSAKSLALAFVNAAANVSQGNLLQNSEFVTFTTANVPDNWTILTGTAGTQILKSTSGYQDSTSLEMAGDGSTLTSICQKFNVTPIVNTSTSGSGGTPTNLLTLPDVPFAVNFWYKLSAASPAAGQLQCDLIDSTATIINDDQGTANSKNIDLTAVGDTNWHNANAVFRLPAADTANTPIALRFWQPTGHALTSGKNVFIDRVALTQMSLLYGGGTNALQQPNAAGVGGGPFVAAFSGNVQTLVNDYWTVALTNTWGLWAQVFQILFNMTALGMRLPTSGGSTISTTLIA